MDPDSKVPQWWQKWQENYISPYRTLLVLSSLAMLISLFFDLPNSIQNLVQNFTQNYLHSVLIILSLAICLPLSLSGLILLWRKNRTGIKLKLLAYGLSSLLIIGSLWIDPTAIIEQTSAQTYQQLKQSSATINLDYQALTDLTQKTYYLNLWLSLFFNGLFAWLWLTTFRKQTKYDTKS